MNKRKALFTLLCAILAIAAQQARADEVKIYTDCTSSASTSWTGNSGTYTGLTGYTGYNSSTVVEYYVASSTGISAGSRVMYQTVSGLEAGTYEVQVYATAHDAWQTSSLDGITIDSALTDVAQVYALSGTAKDSVAVPAYENGSMDTSEPLTFSVTVEVESGNDLEFGIEVLKSGYVNWLTIQLVALYKVETVEVGDDVTSTYITNSGFESCTASTDNETGYVDYADNGWTISRQDYGYGVVMAYGANTYLCSATYGIVPGTAWNADDTDTTNNNALGISLGWGNYSYYTSDSVTLPKGTYTLVYHSYNSNRFDFWASNYTGFVTAGGTTYYSSKTAFANSEWETGYVQFTLEEATTGYFRVGGVARSGVGSVGSAFVWFDDLTLYYEAPVTTYDISEYIGDNWGFESCEAATSDVTEYVDYSSTGWKATTEGSFTYGAVMAYGGSTYLSNATYGIVPTSAWDESTDNKNTLGIVSGWGSTMYYTGDTICLPAGTYHLSYHSYNSSTNGTSWSSNYTGFVTLDGTEYNSTKTSFASQTWEKDSVTFELTEETAGYIRVGGIATTGSSSGAAYVWFDDITLATETEFSDSSPITTLGVASMSIEDNATLAQEPTSFSIAWPYAWTTSTSLGEAGVLNSSATATLTQGATTVATCSLSVSDDGTFTADLSSVEFSTDVVYTLTIPAGIYGWSAGTSNAETTVSFTISSLEAGTYIWQAQGQYQYLSHGGNYGTQAVTGAMGIPFTLEMTSSGWTLKNVSHTVNVEADRYLFIDNAGLYYVDGSSPSYWTFESVTDDEGNVEGYRMKNSSDNYIGVSEEQTSSDYYHYSYLQTVTSQDDATVWVLHVMDENSTDGVSAYASYYETLSAMKDEQAAATAELAGLSDVTSMSTLETAIEGYTAYDRTWAIQNADMGANTGWSSTGCGSSTSVNSFSTYETKYVSSGGITYLRNVSGSAGTFYQTLSGLPFGIYKVSAVGGYNATSQLWDIFTSSIDGLGTTLSDGLTDEEKMETSPAWLYANSSSQRTVGLMDGYQGLVGNITSTELVQLMLGTSTIDPSEYLSAFVDTFYVYVGEGESLTLGGIDPGSSDTTIILAANWELTFLSDVPCQLGSYTVSIADSAMLDTFDSLTVSYPYAWTVDSTNYASTKVLNASGATLYVGSSTEAAATGTITLTSDGFTVKFSDYTFLSGQSYTIVIAENSYGYVSNETVSGAANAADTITFFIPSVADGVYYLKAVTDDEAASEYSYLSHGSTWGTRATVDSYGLPVTVAAGWDGATFYFSDNQNYLFDNNDKSVYTDNSTRNNWSVVSTADSTGYVVASANSSSSYNGYYLYIDEYNNVNLASTQDSATVWTFETPSEHKTVMQTYKDTQATNAATAASITSSDITDAATFATWLAENRTEVDITLNTTVSSVQESWQKNSGGARNSWSGVVAYDLATDTITLSEGLYKLSIQGFTRFASNAVTETLEGARSLVFLTATVGDVTYETQLLSSFDYSATSYTATDTILYDGYYYPNGTSSATEAFTAGYYPNDVYFYVSEETGVYFALTDEHYYAASADEWVCWQYLTLTRYAAESTVDSVYLRTTDSDGNYLYLSRGADYNSRIIADEYGLPVQLTTSDGISQLYLFDNQQYVFDDLNGSVYGDNSTNSNWELEAVDESDDSYYLKNANQASSNYGQYVVIDDDNYFAFSETASTAWTLEQPADHNSNADAAYDRQAVAAASDAGISVDSKEDLETYLAANFAVDSIELTTTQTSVTENYQGGATSGWGYSFNTLATQTVELSEGFYKFSVQAFHRFASNTLTEELGGARGQVFLYAGDERVNILSPFDYSATSYTATDTYSSGSDYYPNGTSSASEAFSAGNYANDVYFYVPGDTTLTLALIDEQAYGSVDIQQWTCWQDFSLVRYAEKIPVTISTVGWASLYYSEHNLRVPDGVRAYTVALNESSNSEYAFIATATAIDKLDGDTSQVIPKGVAVLIESTETLSEKTTFYFLSVGDDKADSENVTSVLKGCDEDSTISESGYTYYQFSLAANSTDVSTLGFYYQAGTEGKSIKTAAHKAYLAVESTSSAKGIGFQIGDGEATGISSVNASEAKAIEGIYTLTGMKVGTDIDQLPAGIYIIDGKKTLIR